MRGVFMMMGGDSNGCVAKENEWLSRTGGDFGWWVVFLFSKWNECCVVFLVISLSNHESQEFGYSLVGNLWERNCLFLKTISENMSDVLCILECIYRGWWNGYVVAWKCCWIREEGKRGAVLLIAFFEEWYFVYWTGECIDLREGATALRFRRVPALSYCNGILYSDFVWMCGNIRIWM